MPQVYGVMVFDLMKCSCSLKYYVSCFRHPKPVSLVVHEIRDKVDVACVDLGIHVLGRAGLPADLSNANQHILCSKLVSKADFPVRRDYLSRTLSNRNWSL